MQNQFERILAAWVSELAVPIVRRRAVTGFAQRADGVEVELSDGQSMRADYLVGCDGGRSVIRKAAGIEFPGWDPSVSSLIAEAEMGEEPQWGIRYTDQGTQAIGRQEDGKRVGVVVTERYAGQSGEPTLADLSRAIIAVWGTDYGVHSPTYISRFTDATRQAAAYRQGRVLIAGDAAHVHYPVGGQGLGEGHPLVGRRVPDLDLVTADGPRTVFTLLHEARPVLLNLGQPSDFDIAPWADRVRLAEAEYAGRWDLPLLGPVAAPAAVLIRPDGYVAWAGDPAEPELPDALATWFGRPRWPSAAE
jgi:FAD binding domain